MATSYLNNISLVRKANVCVGCGACVASCSTGAISFEFANGFFQPKVDVEKCNGCGVCLRVCPSYSVDAIRTFPILDFDNDNAECYTAFSKNEVVRRVSTSGGVITSIVLRLLETNEYDKAYLLDYENFCGDRAALKPVSSMGDIMKSVKSKYIPASIEHVIEDIKNHTIGKSIVVATPCQTLAIKCFLNHFHSDGNDILFLGLFCDMAENYGIYKHFEDKYGKFESLHFRDKVKSGWPGNVTLMQNGEIVDVPRDERISVKEKYKLNRCNYCFDKLNMLADISFGDCYIQGEDDVKGRSSVVIRTPKGEAAFKLAKTVLESEKSSFSLIKKSQHLDEKRVNLFRNIAASVFSNIPFEYGTSGAFKSKKDANSSFFRKLFFGNTKKQSIKIFIENVGFDNRGDQLMIQSVVEQVRIFVPESQIVVRHSVFDQNPSYCKQNGLYPLQPEREGLKRARYNLAVKLINKPWMITADQIDVVLDCRGYYIGDAWLKTEDDYHSFCKNYEQFSKTGRKIVLLPQAFGPFENKYSSDCLKFIYKMADRIYARDEVSFNYMQSVLDETKKIKVAPDFTCLVHPKSACVLLPYRQYVLLVPNARMLDQTDSDVSSRYIDFFIAMADHLKNRGECVYLLNHEGQADENLLQRINSRLNAPLPILTNLTGMDAKSIIKGAKLLVSARFHGVVSGLTQGVPTLCTSWSHKYKELLIEHECELSMLDVCDLERSLKTIDDALNNPLDYSSKIACRQKIEASSRMMWKEIFELLK